MERPDEAAMREYMEAVFQKLSQAGWLTHYVFDITEGSYRVVWTAKGRERARWVKLISDELTLGPKGLTTLLTICDKYPPDESEEVPG